MEYRWVFFVLLTLLVWGCWGFLTRVAAASLGWRDTTAIAAIGNMIAAVSFIMLSRAELAPQSPSWFAALSAGVLGFLGALTFYVALDQNPSSLVIVATSLYPIITIILSVLLLGENMSVRQMVGAAFAILALILISGR